MVDDQEELEGEMFMLPGVDCAIHYPKGVAKNTAELWKVLLKKSGALSVYRDHSLSNKQCWRTIKYIETPLGPEIFDNFFYKRCKGASKM